VYNLYKVSLKIGKRTITSDFYARSSADILTFCHNNLIAEVSKIMKVEYEASDSKTYPVDDPSGYKRTAYFSVRSSEGVAKVLPLQTIKIGRSYDQVFNDMRTYLGTSDQTGIDAYTAITESSK